MKKIISGIICFCLIFSSAFALTLLPDGVRVNAENNYVYEGFTFGEVLYPVAEQEDITVNATSLANAPKSSDKALNSNYWNTNSYTLYTAEGKLRSQADRVYNKTATALEWDNYMWEADVTPHGSNSSRHVGLMIYSAGNQDGYFFGISTKAASIFDMGAGGKSHTLENNNKPIDTVAGTYKKDGTTYHLSVAVYEGVIYCYVDGALVLSKAIDDLSASFNKYTKGTIGFAGNYGATYSNFKATKILNIESFLFEDDFNDGVSNPAWSAATGETDGKISKTARLYVKTLGDIKDYTVSADVSYTGKGTATSSKGVVSVTARNTDGSNKNIIEFGIGATGQNTSSPVMKLFFSERINSATPTIDVEIPYSGELKAGTEYNLKLTVIGNKAYCYFENQCVYVTKLTSSGEVATLSKGYPGWFTRNSAGTCDNFKVTEAKLVETTGITLDRISITLDEGKSETLRATVIPSNATDKLGIWTSSDESVATVTSGVITGVSKGTAVITVTCGEFSESCTVTINEVVYVPEFSDNFDDGIVSPEWSTDTLEENGVAVLAKDNSTGRIVNAKNIEGASTWQDYSVEADVKYLGAGIATTNVGAAYISARANGESAKSDMVGFGIGEKNRKTLAEPILAFREYVGGKESVTIIQYDGTINPYLTNKLKLVVIDDTAFCYFNGEFVYKAKINVASGYSGMIALNGQGEYDNFVVTSSQNVPLTGISLSREALMLSVGKTSDLSVVTLPLDATNDNIIWKSDNEAVATVVNGTVTAVSSGTAIITATSEEGGYTADCIVNVTEGLLFSDDFEGSAIDSAWENSASVSYKNDGRITLGMQSTALLSGIADSANWTDYTVESDIIYNDAGTSTTNTGAVGVLVYSDGTKQNGFFFGIGFNWRQTNPVGTAIFVNIKGGAENDKQSVDYNISAGVSYKLKVEVYGSMIYCYVDGNLVYITQNDSHTFGTAGLNTRNCTGYAESYEVTVSDKLNAFTGKEPEESIWFTDNFDTSETFITERGWSHGNAVLKKGNLVLNDGTKTEMYLNNVLDCNVWQNYVVEADVKITDELMKNNKEKTAMAGIVARNSGKNTGIEFNLVLPENGKTSYVELYDRQNKKSLGSYDVSVNSGETVNLKLTLEGNKVYAFVNQKLAVETVLTEGNILKGTVGLISKKYASAFDNVAVRKATLEDYQSAGITLSPQTGESVGKLPLAIVMLLSALSLSAVFIFCKKEVLKDEVF